MDPQDLLYTNSFVQSDVISKTQLRESQENYGRFRNYVGSREIETNQYIDTDSKESDPFNINKTLQEPFPTNLKKNHYPTFDTYINDISKNRYQKERLTKISVNSKDRNKQVRKVKFTTSIDLDAKTRDLTINSLYLKLKNSLRNLHYPAKSLA